MQIFNRMWCGLCAAGIIAALSSNTTIVKASDDDDLILDLFVQKGFVSQDEANRVKAEAEARRTNETQTAQAPEISNWKITKALKNEELFGDVRLRYEDRSANDPSGNSIDLQRYRYAVRFGLRGNLFDNFYYGMRIETSANARSSWATFGTSSSGVPYQGPYGKSTAGINIGQAYIGWRPDDWADLTIGKMPNPLYTTPLVWDPDLNPEGAAERFNYAIGDADFFATFGQFIYETFSPNSASGGLGINGLAGQNLDNIFQFAFQGGGKYNFTTNTSLKVAATIYRYFGLQRSTVTSSSALAPYFGDPYIGEGAYYLNGGAGSADSTGYSGYGTSTTLPGYQSYGYPLNQVGLNHLLVLEIPFEFDFSVWNFDARLFGDFAYNLDGAQRARDAAAAYAYVLQNTPGAVTSAAFSPQTHDVKAYQIGLDLASHGGIGLISGETARRHAWEFKTYWQHTEQYALDPNIIDSDIFEGRENLEGIYLAGAYGITDNLILGVHYGYANRINKLLGTGGSNQDLPWMNPINSYQIIQVDMMVKF